MIETSYVVGAEVNYYFMVACTFLVAIFGTIVAEKTIEPRQDKHHESEAGIDLGEIN